MILNLTPPKGSFTNYVCQKNVNVLCEQPLMLDIEMKKWMLTANELILVTYQYKFLRKVFQVVFTFKNPSQIYIIYIGQFV